MENSEKMQRLQKEKLGKRCEDMGAALTWCDKFEEVQPCKFRSRLRGSSLWPADEYTLFIAHEFFDAMPFNVFEVSYHAAW